MRSAWFPTSGAAARAACEHTTQREAGLAATHREASLAAGVRTRRRASSPSRAPATTNLARLLGATRYELVRAVACGGMGEIFEVRERATGRRAALKLAAGQGEARLDCEQRLRFEAELLARLRHPGIVAFREAGRLGDGRDFLVMEWVGGPTVRQLLGGEQPLALGALARWMDELLAALAAMHRAGFLHGDVKPDNVLVEARTGVRLIDLGAAEPLRRRPRGSLPGAGPKPTTAPCAARRAVPSGVVARSVTLRGPGPSPSRASSFVIGTPRYLAPERRAGEPSDRRADLYAVGVLLLELLEAWARRWPLGRLDAALGTRLDDGALRGVPEPLARLRRELAAVARRACAPDVRHRYASAERMQDALRTALGNAARTPSVRTQGRR